MLRLLDAPPLLVVSDFDGTLSPIHPDPLGARIEPLGRAALRRLARLGQTRPDLVRPYVLSGRTVADVAGRVRVGELDYVGNHGLEAGRLASHARPESIRVRFDPGFGRFAGPATKLADRVSEALGHPAWLFVEAKGPSVAFHFRQATDRVGALRQIEAALHGAGFGRGGADDPTPDFERFDGRMVIELRPIGAGGKGAAMARLLERERPGAVLVLGDDRSDAEAFRIVTSGRSEGRYDALAVGVHGATETPDELRAAADVILASPHDAARLLSFVGRRLSERP